MNTTVFFLGSHPALSAAEIAAYCERVGLRPTWDPSRLPVVLFARGDFPAPTEIQRFLGGTTMIGTLRTTFSAIPTPEEITAAVPEILQPRRGKRLIGLSALPCYPSQTSKDELSTRVRARAMGLKRAIGMKGTRVVFPPARRSDLSTAQLLHNKLPREGTAIFFIVAPKRVDLVTIDAIQDIEGYARRDRGRPQVDPGTGMLPPKVAQMLLNLSLVPPGGTIYDPFCGVGTIPMEALLFGLRVIASDRSPAQVERTKENLAWLAREFSEVAEKVQDVKVFGHDVTKGASPLPPHSIDAIVTEGWLGPPRTSLPQPTETAATFSSVTNILTCLLSSGKAVLRPGGCALVTVPAFRVRKRLIHFPLDTLKTGGFRLESLLPSGWNHEIFRESARGTLLYGRPDAIVLREIVRFRKLV